LIELLKR